MGIEILIDYENLPGQTNNVRDIANQINVKLIDVYNKIEKMHEYWYGMRYNDLVGGFNQMIPQLNRFLKVIETEIPYAIDKIANNFSNVDIRQKITREQRTEIKSIQPLPIINDIGLRYLDKEVESIQTEIKTEFNEIRTLSNEIEGKVKQMVIESDRTNEFKSQINRLLNSFNQSISNIEVKFEEAMNKTREQMERLENLNSVQ